MSNKIDWIRKHKLETILYTLLILFAVGDLYTTGLFRGVLEHVELSPLSFLTTDLVFYACVKFFFIFGIIKYVLYCKKLDHKKVYQFLAIIVIVLYIIVQGVLVVGNYTLYKSYGVEGIQEDYENLVKGYIEQGYSPVAAENLTRSYIEDSKLTKYKTKVLPLLINIMLLIWFMLGCFVIWEGVYNE